MKKKQFKNKTPDPGESKNPLLNDEMDDSGSVVATTLARMKKWPYHDFATTPPPPDVDVIVRLEKPKYGSLYHVARFGKVPMIASWFAWDAPRPTHWAYIPEFQEPDSHEEI